jgi:hypothetical protein
MPIFLASIGDSPFRFLVRVDPFNSSSKPRNLKVTHNRYRSKYPNNVQHQPNHTIDRDSASTISPRVHRTMEVPLCRSFSECLGAESTAPGRDVEKQFGLLTDGLRRHLPFFGMFVVRCNLAEKLAWGKRYVGAVLCMSGLTRGLLQCRCGAYEPCSNKFDASKGFHEQGWMVLRFVQCTLSLDCIWYHLNANKSSPSKPSHTYTT